MRRSLHARRTMAWCPCQRTTATTTGQHRHLTASKEVRKDAQAQWLSECGRQTWTPSVLQLTRVRSQQKPPASETRSPRWKTKKEFVTASMQSAWNMSSEQVGWNIFCQCMSSAVSDVIMHWERQTAVFVGLFRCCLTLRSAAIRSPSMAKSGRLSGASLAVRCIVISLLSDFSQDLLVCLRIAVHSATCRARMLGKPPPLRKGYTTVVCAVHGNFAFGLGQPPVSS